jgi:hypothetical protein
MRLYILNEKDVLEADLYDTSVITGGFAVPCMNLAHCIFMMKYWVVSKKIEHSLLIQQVSASFDKKVLIAMIFLSLLYFFASLVVIVAMINGGNGNPSQKVMFACGLVMDLPPLIAIPFFAAAFWRMSKISGNLQWLSKKQIWLQMIANSLYAVVAPFIDFFNSTTLAYIIFAYLVYFSMWFGLMVLVKTICEIIDFMVPLPDYTYSERHSAYIESEDISSAHLSEIRKAYSGEIKHLTRTSCLSADEQSIYDHFIGAKGSFQQL